MEYNFSSPLLLYCYVILLPIFILLFLKPNKRSLTKLHPSPPGWPVFGHMFQLGTLPYVTMANMKEKYGPAIWLKIWSTLWTMVVQSANAAAEFYKYHDLSFPDRVIVDTITSHDFHKSSFVFAPCGSYWRMLRRLCISSFNSKIDGDSVQVRRKCLGKYQYDWKHIVNI
ncbi:hypothetical protein LIER_26744 [Lithospermum erythrorhizon]|uniref:Cytochrome P450 n=1 Tax=Lithospermum erythrorhizon TaxID=34254 RepID=A0AAV3RD47_LITER